MDRCRLLHTKQESNKDLLKSTGDNNDLQRKPSICWIVEKAREFQKNIYCCFTDYAKAFDCVDHNKLWMTPKYQVNLR